MLNQWFVKFFNISIVCFFAGVFLLEESVDALESRILSGKNADSLEGSDFLSGRDWDWDWNKRDNFKCPSSNGIFPDIKNCAKYYVCNNGRSRHRSCSRNMRFDRYRKKCMWFVVAVCDDRKDHKKTTRPDETSTTKKGDKFSCPRFMGTFPDPEDCSKYYSCSFLVATLKTCPKKQLFDGVQKECKPANEVHCGSRKRPTSETTISTTPLVSSTLPITSTPEPTTPETTTLEPTTTEPTTPESTTPEPTTPDTTTPEPTTPEPTTSEPTTPEPTTPEPTTPEPTTPEPTGPPDTDCDENDVDCIIDETGGENPTWFKCPEPVGSYGHASSVKLFIFCENWKPYVKRCEQNLVYSNEVRTCVSKGADSVGAEGLEHPTEYL